MARENNGSHTGSFRVVVVGGGVAALEAVLALRTLADERLTIDVIAPDREFIYTPLVVAEPFGSGRRTHFDLGELVRDAGGRHHVDAVTEVDVARRLARTRTAISFPYDALLIAAGTTNREPLPGALTFPGRVGVTGVRHVLSEIEESAVHRLVFAVPSSVSWALPLYELALMTASRLRKSDRTGVKLSLVTPEEHPLACFGVRASAVLTSRLERSGIRLRTGVYPSSYDGHRLELVPDRSILADRVITLAVPSGTDIAGVPTDEGGFVATDEYGAVLGAPGVYAAGDVTAFPLKQGGIAAQQADVAARSIAAAAGMLVTRVPFRPVLRGMLLTGDAPAYLRSPIAGGDSESMDVAVDPLWWPPAKIAARYLGPFLNRRAGDARPYEHVAEEGFAVAREFDAERGTWHDLEERQTA